MSVKFIDKNGSSYVAYINVRKGYGRFKREFCELVNVPGRSDIEIGKNLKNAVPERYQHLINHLPTSDHEGMMKVLDNF